MEHCLFKNLVGANYETLSFITLLFGTLAFQHCLRNIGPHPFSEHWAAKTRFVPFTSCISHLVESGNYPPHLILVYVKLIEVSALKCNFMLAKILKIQDYLR